MCTITTSRTPGCVKEMVNELGWESLQDRRQISRLNLIYKAHHGYVDIDKATYLKTGDIRTRSHTGFYQEHTAHEVYHNSFFPRTIREWNRLPNSVTSAPTVERLPCLPVQQAMPSLNHDQLPYSSYL